MTVLAADRPGLVSILSETIAMHGGNWQESRMAHLAGQFAGILRVECPPTRSAELLESLAKLEDQGISVLTRREATEVPAPRETLALDVVGNDRPGIIRALSAAITTAGANVEDLVTSLESAPMSGHPIFHATGRVSLARDRDLAGLISAIEGLGPDLSVSITA